MAQVVTSAFAGLLRTVKAFLAHLCFARYRLDAAQITGRLERSGGALTLRLIEADDPAYESGFRQVLQFLKDEYGAKEEGSLDGLDWFDVDLRIDGKPVTPRQGCWEGVELIAWDPRSERTLHRIGVRLEQNPPPWLPAAVRTTKISK